MPAAEGKLIAQAMLAFADEPPASLTETLNVMTATLVPEACRSLPIPGKSIDEAGILANPEVAGALGAAIEALAKAAMVYQSGE